MATTTNISVSITAVTAGFSKGMSRAASTVGQFSKAVTSTGAKVTAFASTLAAAAGVAGMGALVKSSFESIDALAKASDRLGVTTEKLAGLHHAAGLAGGSTEAIDKGLAKMGRSIVDANNGIGEAVDSFNTLGLSTNALLGMSPDQQFATIADALSNVENQSIKNALAFDIFGRSSEDLMNTLALGSEGLNKAQAEAEKLGLAMNRVDAAKIEMANDAITRLKGAVTGVANRMAVKLAPIVTVVADKFTNWLTKIDFSEILSGTSFLAKGIGFVADSIQSLQIAWNWLDSSFKSIIAGLVTELAGVVSIADDVLAKFGKGPSDIGKKLNSWSVELTKSARESEKRLNDLRNAPAWSEGIAKTFDSLSNGINDTAQGIAKNAGKNFGVGLGDGMEDAQKNLEQMASKVMPFEKADFRLPGIAEAGSKEAFSAISGARLRDLNERYNREMLNEQKRTNALLDKLVGNDRVPPQLVDAGL